SRIGAERSTTCRRRFSGWQQFLYFHLSTVFRVRLPLRARTGDRELNGMVSPDPRQSTVRYISICRTVESGRQCMPLSRGGRGPGCPSQRSGGPTRWHLARREREQDAVVHVVGLRLP